MSYAPHMELITELMPLLRRDFETALDLNPDTTEPVVDGEWLELNASYTLIRGSGERLVPCFPVFAERGRYDTQAIGKLPVIFGGMYEFDTDLVNSGHGITLGAPVCVADVTAAGGTKKGLIVCAGGATSHFVVGWCTRLPASGKVRILHTGYTYLTT